MALPGAGSSSSRLLKTATSQWQARELQSVHPTLAVDRCRLPQDTKMSDGAVAPLDAEAEPGRPGSVRYHASIVSSLTGSRVGRVRRKVAPEEGREPDPNPRQVLVAMRERVRRVDGMLPFSVQLNTPLLASVIMFIFCGVLLLQGLDTSLSTFSCASSDVRDWWCQVPSILMLACLGGFALVALGLSLPATRKGTLRHCPGIAATVWVLFSLADSVQASRVLVATPAELQALQSTGTDDRAYREVERLIAYAVGIAFTVVATSDAMVPSWVAVGVATRARAAASALSVAGQWRVAAACFDLEAHGAFRYGPAIPLTLVVEPLFVGLMIVAIRPAWLLGRKGTSGVTRFALLLRSLVPSSVGWLRAAVSTVLCGSLLALVACAVCGVSLGSSASLAVMVVVVMMIRYTMEVQIRLLDAELQEAVTTDVAETLIQRAMKSRIPAAFLHESNYAGRVAQETPAKDAASRAGSIRPLFTFQGPARGSFTSSRAKGAAGAVAAVQTAESLSAREVRRRRSVDRAMGSEGGSGRRAVGARSEAGVLMALPEGGAGAGVQNAGVPREEGDVVEISAASLGSSLGTPQLIHANWSPGGRSVVVPRLPYMRTLETVTVVFTDIVGYTAMSFTLPPVKVLKMLHEYFTKLDALMDLAGTFKYQTVGDAYVVVAGYPNPSVDDALTAVRTAHAMVQVATSVHMPQLSDARRGRHSSLGDVEGPRGRRRTRSSANAVAGEEEEDAEGSAGPWVHTDTDTAHSRVAGLHRSPGVMRGGRRSPGRPHSDTGGEIMTTQSSEGTSLPRQTLRIRVGVHTGPLAASTLGFKRNCLTLVGDTLNTASRMESSSRPGHIRMSAATYWRLPSHVRQCFQLETIDVKGKGPMDTYIADGLSIPLCK